VCKNDDVRVNNYVVGLCIVSIETGYHVDQRIGFRCGSEAVTLISKAVESPSLLITSVVDLEAYPVSQVESDFQ